MSGNIKTRPVDHDPFAPQLVKAPKTRSGREELIDTMRRMASQSTDGNYRGALDQMEMAMFSAYPNRFLAMHNGMPVGAIAFGSSKGAAEDHVEVHHLGSIHPGVGKMLLEQAMQHATKTDKIIHLHSTEEAVPFYERMGFTQRNEYENDPVMQFDPSGMGPGETWKPETEEKEHPLIDGLRQAADGNWYIPNPDRPGKYLQVVEPSKGV
jgi:hypothetical protein